MNLKFLNKRIMELGEISIDSAWLNQQDSDLDALLKAGHFMDKDRVIRILKAKDRQFKKLDREKDLLQDIFRMLGRCLDDDYSKAISKRILGSDEGLSSIEIYVRRIGAFESLLEQRFAASKAMQAAVRRSDEDEALDLHVRTKGHESGLMEHHALAEQVHGELYRSLREADRTLADVPAPKTSYQRMVAIGTAIAIGFAVYMADLGPKAIKLGPRAALAGDVLQHRSVNDILAPIKNKVFVDKDTYLQEVAKSDKAVVFFYNGQDDKTEICRSLAQVWSSVMIKYPKIKLICYDMDKENLSGQYYIDNFGFTGTPFYSFIAKGKVLFKHKGGPKKSRILNEIKVQEKNMLELSSM
ncbi:hypothetical protein DESC_530019 [Desulfosarcina cetonica]|uniref:hypothetical protein n=1 Tax=Desulfosarcina cetonica TaxID=90730 RepID=UPI0006CF64BD|nr:hypothetical protein [Desulfosarcina cetonica]VTR66905.1 hypothetical protein DESC_530019 [Desulfosarcina cetonica]